MAAVLTERLREEPDAIALRDNRVELSWGEIDQILRRIINGLRARPLRESRRIAVFAENSAEVVLAHLGGLLAGVATVPINYSLTAEEAAFILRDSDASILFVGPECLDRGLRAAQAAGTSELIAWRSSGAALSWDSFLAEASTEEPPEDIPLRPHFVYTSGTTGLPKGVELPPTIFSPSATIGGHLNTYSRTNPSAGLGPHLVVGPLYHTGPLSHVRLLGVGTPIIVLGRFDPEAVLEAICRYEVATAVMVPTHFKRLLELPQSVKARYDVSSLRRIAHTGAACPVDVKRSMIEWFGPVLIDSYGSTEAGTLCSIDSAQWMVHPGSVGRAVPPFARTIVVDENGQEVPPGNEGRLFFEDSSGRGIIYANDPAKTAEAHLRPGVFTIGEIGYVTDDGYVYITDRSSDMVLSGGVNIYPAESEAVILTHPKVADVAVIGIPHADLGETPLALVVAKDHDNEPTPDELIALCRSRLASYKCPRRIEFVKTVGRNAMGKLNKRVLRAPYWEGTRTIG